MPAAFVPSHRTAPVNLFTDGDFTNQRVFFRHRPEIAATPLHRCSGLARRLGVGHLLVKDETSRYGLNAFKAVGAAFAIATLKDRGELHAGDTLVCASEGNHGRAVARVAREAGCRALVYMSQRVSPARVDAIRGEGADVTLIDGSYDDAVRVMARDAAAAGWVVISDTSWPGYSEIPRLIVLGYTRIMDEDWGDPAAGSPTFEVRRQSGPAATSESKPDVVFGPAGVGGLLAAVACWCDWRYGAARPAVVAAEPLSAACLQASARHGRPTTVSGPFETVMGGLRCGEMSPDVFPAVHSIVDAYVAIEDEFAFEAMRMLAHPSDGDPAVISGPSGAAALGAVAATLRDPALDAVRQRLRLGVNSRIQVLVTEGATEPDLVAEVLARP